MIVSDDMIITLGINLELNFSNTIQISMMKIKLTKSDLLQIYFDLHSSIRYTNVYLKRDLRYYLFIKSESAKAEAMSKMGISVQVRRNDEVEQMFFEQYLQQDANCEVYWGTVEEYTNSLRENLME